MLSPWGESDVCYTSAVLAGFCWGSLRAANPKPPVGEVPVFDSAAGYEASPNLVNLRGRLDEIEKRKRKIANRSDRSADGERAKLKLSEAVTRGFIDAELSIEE